MKRFNITLFNVNEDNIDKFFKVIEECSEKVELVSDGFRVDMRSKLAQYVSIAKIFMNKEAGEVELVVYNPDDANRFLEFMLE